jgi:hypothetical protein
MDMKDHRKRPRDPAQLAKFIVVKDDDGAVVCSAKCATRWIARMVARAAESEDWGAFPDAERLARNLNRDFAANPGNA